MLHKILYYASGVPSACIYRCAITIRQRVAVLPVLLVYQSQSSLRMYSVVLLSLDQLDVDGQSFAPIGLHKTDAASDWLFIKGTALAEQI
jgi:hypothetical protein